MFPEDQATGVTQTVSASGEKQNQILSSIKKLTDNGLIGDKEKLWPEVVRLILLYARNEDPDIFGPFDADVTSICGKLSNIKPEVFNTALSYEEKVTLLSVQIDIIHETNEFRMFLNKRNDEKSTYNREKMELYQKIRENELAKEKFLKAYAEDEDTQTQEQMESNLVELRRQLSSASRTESKAVIDRIREVERKLNSYTKQVGSFDEKAKRYSTQIGRLNEKAFKSSIKTTILGKDADKSEYWHFKDDCSRLYVRMERQVPIKVADTEMADD